MTLQQQLREPSDIFGFGLRQPQLTDVLQDLLFLQLCHGRRLRPSRKQSRGHLVHFFIRALGAEQHCDQQRE